MLTQIRERGLDSVHDLSDGGLLVAVAEMAIAGGRGVTLDPAAVDGPAHAFWFGEDQGRYVVALPEARAAALVAVAEAAGVAAIRLGVTGGDALELPGEAPIPLPSLVGAYESWFPAYMDGGRA